MSRFDEHDLRRFRARDGIIAVSIAALLLATVLGRGELRRLGSGCLVGGSTSNHTP